MEMMKTVSMNATRRHPWEAWTEHDEGQVRARYFGVTVEVIQGFEHWTLIRRPDGLSAIVETRDLVEVRP